MDWCLKMKTIIENVRAVVPSGNGFMVRDCDICMEGGVITAMDAVDKRGAARVIDGRGKLAIPGLINAHTHVYMTLFRNSADDLPFNKWLFDRIMPMEDRLQQGDSYWTTLFGISEMLRTGTTAFLDMYIFPDDIARAVADSGIRAVLSRGLVGEDRHDAGGLRRIREARQDFDAYRAAADGRISFMLAPHAPYTCAPDYLAFIAETAAEMDVGIHTHIAESANEVETIREKYGCSPVEMMERSGLFARKTAAAHCVFLQPDDFRILRQNGVSVLTNPSSNMKLGNGFAPVPEMLENGINIALGTDSAASNNTLNMFHELNLLSLIHKGTHKDAVTVTAAEAFRAATRGGAQALDIPAGELAVGKKADVVLLDLSKPQLNPPTDYVSSLCYSANGSEVDTVLVDGKVLYEKGRLTTIDEERVRYETCRIYKRVSGE